MENNKLINELISQLNQKIIQDCLYRDIINKQQELCDTYKHYNELSSEREKSYSDICDKWSKQVEIRDKFIESYQNMLRTSQDRENKFYEEKTEYEIKVINLYKVSFWHRLCFLFNPYHIDNTLLDEINKNVLAKISENKVQD